MPGVLMAGCPASLTTWLQQRLPDSPVHVIHSGHETLRQLAQHTYSMLIIDHSVIQPAALEVVRQMRRRPDLMTLPVIYCAHHNVGSDLTNQLVEQLGVSQLMFHPLDRDAFASQIAALLGQPLASVPGAETPAQQQTMAAVAAIWGHFKGTIARRMAVLEHAVTALLEGTLEDGRRHQAEREAHKLAGAIGTFGFMEGSRLARELEHMFQAGMTLDATHAPALSARIVALGQELERPLPLARRT